MLRHFLPTPAVLSLSLCCFFTYCVTI